MQGLIVNDAANDGQVVVDLFTHLKQICYRGQMIRHVSYLIAVLWQTILLQIYRCFIAILMHQYRCENGTFLRVLLDLVSFFEVTVSKARRTQLIVHC